MNLQLKNIFKNIILLWQYTLKSLFQFLKSITSIIGYLLLSLAQNLLLLTIACVGTIILLAMVIPAGILILTLMPLSKSGNKLENLNSVPTGSIEKPNRSRISRKHIINHMPIHTHEALDSLYQSRTDEFFERKMN